ncbi:MAG: cytochrome c biogenesis protein, partial [bacterium]
EEIYFFYGEGCPHCVLVEKYFQENGLFDRYPIVKKEVYGDHENAILFNNVLDKLGVASSERGVPTVVVGNKVMVGDKPIIDDFIKIADEYLLQSEPENITRSEVEDKSTSLTLIAVVLASMVDAINPCAFAVLIILMSTILVAGNGKKALKAGLAFSASIFISYLLMGLGIYSVLGAGEFSYIFFRVVGWLAILLGIFNLKDYFWYGRGFLMEVPISWRPKMKNVINSVTSPVGAFGVGFVVSLFLLPCTSGPYIVILGMLAKEALQVRAVLYLILYNLIFVLPMVLISVAVYKGFDPAKAEEMRQKRLKTLHLIAGIVMLVMGVVILGGWI